MATNSMFDLLCLFKLVFSDCQLYSHMEHGWPCIHLLYFCVNKVEV